MTRRLLAAESPLEARLSKHRAISSQDTRRFFTANLVRRIALHRRLSCDAVEQGIGLALPALLEALADLASRPLGAGILACSVARQYPATLETIRNGIGSESQDVAAAYGSGYMAYLVGEPAFASACADIGWASRLDEQETKLLVGLVGWILMSRLRLEQRRRALEPGRARATGPWQLQQTSRGRWRQNGTAHCARSNRGPQSPALNRAPRGRVNADRAGVPRAGRRQRPRNLARARAFDRPTARQRERCATDRLQHRQGDAHRCGAGSVGAPKRASPHPCDRCRATAPRRSRPLQFCRQERSPGPLRSRALHPHDCRCRAPDMQPEETQSPRIAAMMAMSSAEPSAICEVEAARPPATFQFALSLRMNQAKPPSANSGSAQYAAASARVALPRLAGDVATPRYS